MFIPVNAAQVPPSGQPEPGFSEDTLRGRSRRWKEPLGSQHCQGIVHPLGKEERKTKLPFSSSQSFEDESGRL